MKKYLLSILLALGVLLAMDVSTPMAGTIKSHENNIFVGLFKNSVLDKAFGKNGVVSTFIGENPIVKSIQVTNQIIISGVVVLAQEGSGRIK